MYCLVKWMEEVFPSKWSNRYVAFHLEVRFFSVSFSDVFIALSVV